MKAEIELPPPDFYNAIVDVNPDFDFTNWRKSLEWRSFVAGYNSAVDKANRSTMDKWKIESVANRVA